MILFSEVSEVKSQIKIMYYFNYEEVLRDHQCLPSAYGDSTTAKKYQTIDFQGNSISIRSICSPNAFWAITKYPLQSFDEWCINESVLAEVACYKM